MVSVSLTTDPRDSRRLAARPLAAVVALGLSACAEAPVGRDLDQGDRVAPDGLKIATWNMEWLNRSNNTGVVKRTNADYAKLAEYADLLDADIVAVQVVDGPEALQRVFDPAIYDFHMSSRNHVQRTGYAYRKTLDVTPMPDYTALDVGSLRYGADLQVTVGGQTMRLLDVHLKSGCFTGSLTGSSASCQKLAQQVPPLEAWIDARAAEGMPFMVLGDFNRRMFSNNNDQLWAAIDDGRRTFTPAAWRSAAPRARSSSTTAVVSR